MFKNEKLNLFLFAVLIAIQLLGVVGLLTRFQPSYLPVILTVYFWGGLSHTYLHRYSLIVDSKCRLLKFFSPLAPP